MVLKIGKINLCAANYAFGAKNPTEEVTSIESDKPWSVSPFGLLLTRPGDLIVPNQFRRLQFLCYLSLSDICVFGHLCFGDICLLVTFLLW